MIGEGERYTGTERERKKEICWERERETGTRFKTKFVERFFDQKKSIFSLKASLMDMSDGRGTTHKDPIDNFVCVGMKKSFDSS